jgi:hypothetical protein
MMRIYAIYCVAILLLFSVGNFNGYVATSFLAGQQKADKAANQYHK